MFLFAWITAAGITGVLVVVAVVILVVCCIRRKLKKGVTTNGQDNEVCMTTKRPPKNHSFYKYFSCLVLQFSLVYIFVKFICKTVQNLIKLVLIRIGKTTYFVKILFKRDSLNV